MNTSRGGLLNSDDVIAALKTGKIGRLALDVSKSNYPFVWLCASRDCCHVFLLKYYVTN